jgi:hypothetical protein
MTNLTLATCVAGVLVLVGMKPRDCLAQSGNNSPKLFAPGIISGPADDLSPAFTPDGNTVVFTRGNNSGSVLMVPNRVGGKWSAPVVAPLSGAWNDREPAMFARTLARRHPHLASFSRG